jgi:hypothetical protein
VGNFSLTSLAMPAAMMAAPATRAAHTSRRRNGREEEEEEEAGGDDDAENEQAERELAQLAALVRRCVVRNQELPSRVVAEQRMRLAQGGAHRRLGAASPIFATLPTDVLEMIGLRLCALGSAALCGAGRPEAAGGGAEFRGAGRATSPMAGALRRHLAERDVARRLRADVGGPGWAVATSKNDDDGGVAPVALGEQHRLSARPSASKRKRSRGTCRLAVGMGDQHE